MAVTPEEKILQDSLNKLKEDNLGASNELGVIYDEGADATQQIKDPILKKYTTQLGEQKKQIKNTSAKYKKGLKQSNDAALQNQDKQIANINIKNLAQGAKYVGNISQTSKNSLENDVASKRLGDIANINKETQDTLDANREKLKLNDTQASEAIADVDDSIKKYGIERVQPYLDAISNKATTAEEYFKMYNVMKNELEKKSLEGEFTRADMANRRVQEIESYASKSEKEKADWAAAEMSSLVSRGIFESDRQKLRDMIARGEDGASVVNYLNNLRKRDAHYKSLEEKGMGHEQIAVEMMKWIKEYDPTADVDFSDKGYSDENKGDRNVNDPIKFTNTQKKYELEDKKTDPEVPLMASPEDAPEVIEEKKTVIKKEPTKAEALATKYGLSKAPSDMDIQEYKDSGSFPHHLYNVLPDSQITKYKRSIKDTLTPYKLANKKAGKTMKTMLTGLKLRYPTTSKAYYEGYAKIVQTFVKKGYIIKK